MRVAAPGHAAAYNVVGIAAMLAAMAAFTLNDAFMKLSAAALPIGQLIFMRALFAAPLLAAIMLSTGQRRLLSAFGQPGLLARGLAEILAAALYLAALFHMPIANTTALLQATPLAITAGGALFLGAPVGWRRWLATLAGLIGVAIIIRPGASAFNPYALLAVLSVVFVAARDLITRQLRADVPTLAIALVSMTMVGVSGLAFLPFEAWRWPPSASALAVLGAAVAMVAAQYWIILGMRSGDIAAVAPFRYSVILWATLAGFLLWQEVPDLASWVGIAIVVAAGLYTFLRERRLAKAAQP